MGLFFESQDVEPVLHQHLRQAYTSDKLDDARAATLATQSINEMEAEISRARRFMPGRVVFAFAVFGALVGGAIAVDAAGLDDSATALFGFAGAVFGVIVGFLGSEKPAR